MDFIGNYIETNKDRLLDELLALLRIPSVSADPKYKADVARTAEAVAESLRKAGADNVHVHPTAGHPIVTAEKLLIVVNLPSCAMVTMMYNLPTLLIYGTHRPLSLL